MGSLSDISRDYKAFRDMVMRRPLADKLALVRELEKETFRERFDELLDRLRNRDGNAITPEEIAKEVEAVRSARYQ